MAEEKHEAVIAPAPGRTDLITILYQNWRGETSVRRLFLSASGMHPFFGVSEWHPEPQWLFPALDAEGGKGWRNYALSEVRAWGQGAVDAALADTALQDTRAESIHRGKMLKWMRDKLIHVRDNLDDEGDRVAFGSTNDCDTLKDVILRLDDFNWSLIMKEGPTPDVIAELAKARREAAAAVTRAEVAENALALIAATPVGQKSITTSLGDLEYEGGHLVKVGGQRPDYMSGDRLIRLVKELAALVPAASAPEGQGAGLVGEEVARLRKALGFYADPRNWIDTPDWDGPDTSTPKAIPVSNEDDGSRPCDCGDVARAALTASTASPNEAPAGPIVGTKTLIVMQREDGKFYRVGCDSPSGWVSDVFDADDRGGLLMLRDAGWYGMVEGELVEVEVTARLTGRRQADLYANGKLLPAPPAAREGE